VKNVYRNYEYRYIIVGGEFLGQINHMMSQVSDVLVNINLHMHIACTPVISQIPY